MIDFESLETTIIGDIVERYIHGYKDQPTMGNNARAKMYHNMFLVVFKFGYMRGKDD